jgi:hypothetical protein
LIAPDGTLSDPSWFVTAGVGMAQKPPIYLIPGDVVELGIEGLGTQRQRAVAHALTKRD